MKLNEIFLLFRVQLLGFFGVNQTKKAKTAGGKRKPRGFVYMALISAAALLYFSAQYSIMIAMTVESGAASPRTLPLFMSFACVLMVLLSTLLKASPTLFGEGDTDILMSLPVRSSSIIASRILVLYAMDFFYTAALLIPMGVVYVIRFHPSALGIALFAVLFFIIPLLPCVLGGVFGTIIEILTAKFGRSNLLRNFLSVLFVVAVMASSFAFSNGNPEQMAKTFENVCNKAAKIYIPLPWIADAFCDGSVVKFLLFTGVSLAAFALFCLVVGSKFKTLVGVVRARRSGRSYKLSAEKNGTPFKALYRKELKRFFSSNTYFMNFGFGMVAAPLSTIAAVIFRGRILEMFSSDAAFMRAVPFILSFFICMSATTACSVSLEGRHFALLRSLPVDAKDLLRSKLAVNLTVTGPVSLLCGAVLAAAFGMAPVEACAVIVLPQLYAVLSAVLGLMANLRYPMMDWKAEVTPIKQSAATFIAVVGFMPLSVVPAIIVMVFTPFYPLVVSALAVVLALVGALCYRSLMKHAEEKIRAISA
ncbi:MAG: hypothetical protein IJU96_06335 [Clostridia bacterium]|nr:hypothetical protein [Clostridia bacterium]